MQASGSPVAARRERALLHGSREQGRRAQGTEAQHASASQSGTGRTGPCIKRTLAALHNRSNRRTCRFALVIGLLLVTAYLTNTHCPPPIFDPPSPSSWRLCPRPASHSNLSYACASPTARPSPDSDRTVYLSWRTVVTAGNPASWANVSNPGSCFLYLS